MKKIIAIALLAIGLGGCIQTLSLPTLNLSNRVNLNTLEGVVAAYGIVVSAENALKQQPLCKTGANPAFNNICVKRSVIVRLQNADRYANNTVNQAVRFVANNPTVNPSQYISTAKAAVVAAQSIINSVKPQGM